jgi:hypothetical protein
MLEGCELISFVKKQNIKKTTFRRSRGCELPPPIRASLAFDEAAFTHIHRREKNVTTNLSES